jgi:hypothetical protein
MTQSPTPNLSFSSDDCAVFAKYPNSASWKDVIESDQLTFKGIREKLKKLAQKLQNKPGALLPLKDFTSLYVPNGRSPKEIWCCVYPLVISNKSYGLQIALIISERGAEICFCQGSGTSQLKDQNKKRDLESTFEQTRKRLGSIPDSLIQSVENFSQRKWCYRNSWLTKPNDSEFNSLTEWLKYASSPEGQAASASLYFTPAELETLDTEIFTVFEDALNTFGPILESVYTIPTVPKHSISQFRPNQFDVKHLGGALITKPFTILTGASGTGKTKLATALASYLKNSDRSNAATIAVGADWTDNRSVLGFVNHLRPLGGKPSYQSTPILDLILRANQDPNYPYFLILDEMNLSHVERYFSDFLSTMEQTDGSLELHKEGENKLLRFEGDELEVPHRIEYPKNLFVIGTVNIDETTYMFSPKVLDRANVIEFTVSEKEISEFLKDPQPYQEIEPAEPGVAEGFLQLAMQAQQGDLEALPPTCSDAIADHLLDLFTILKAGRFEFAYRTAKEVNTYLRVCRHLSEDAAAWDGGEWAKNLDDQVLQKLLPKLHGSMGRIGGLLAALANYCHSGEYKAPENHSGASQQNQSRNQLEEASKLIVEDAKFPRSLEKLQAMIHTLRDEQFVSFIQ